MIIFKKQKSSVFDTLNMQEIKIGNIIQSNKITIKYEEAKKVLYAPMNLGVQEKQISSSKEFDENHLHSKYFGIATHFCLEMMNNFNEDNVNLSLILAKTRYSNYLDEKDFLDIKIRLLNLINNEKFKSIIKDAEFISEQSLIYKEEVKIIDLLLYKNETYYIFDYKTTKDKLPEHNAQVSYYKKAIIDIFETKNVFSYLVYLQDNEISIDEIK